MAHPLVDPRIPTTPRGSIDGAMVEVAAYALERVS